MRSASAVLAGLGTVLLCLGLVADTGLAARGSEPMSGALAWAAAGNPAAARALSFQEQNAVIGQYCFRCHNDVMLTGGMSLEAFDAARAGQNAELAEKMIRQLRAGMMPPSTAQRPDRATIVALATALETTIDEAAAANPNHGGRSFQRLNRAEYERSIRGLLDLEVDAGAYLPPDTISANFDNIADVQGLSATVMDGYLRAAAEISRLAVGDHHATPSEATYEVPRYAEQREHVEGAPFGTRGGISVIHNFPADGEYVFRVSFQHESTGNLFGNGRGALHTAEAPEQIEISVNGERRSLLDIDRWAHRQETSTIEMRTDPIFVRAGPQRVSAAFLRRYEGPVEDLMSPHEWSLADKKIGYSYGITTVPHLRDLVVGGPYNLTGVSATPSRGRIFTCRPTSPGEERPCAEEIISRLGTEAFRRPLEAQELDALMSFYRSGATEAGFETGIRTALQAILAIPDFVFRFEEPDGSVEPGESYRVGDLDLAARLSFFLWGGPPDDELIAFSNAGELSDPAVIEQQVRRMLADPRAEALGTRFAAQWLRLQDLDKVHPDSLKFPNFYQQLADSMQRETELFFENLAREDRSVFELVTADYTFVDERLARHYGIPNVAGTEFRRAEYADEGRRGLLGHGSILTLTSHANRTSPVLRGKWVMEVLLGIPPPPPPPGVPAFEETDAAEGTRLLTVRERMEQHRANPACNSCHRVIDPLGLALENFDVTGAWRIKENGVPIDPSGELYDGSTLNGPDGLRQALLKYSDAFLTTFSENLMAYALGRRVEYYDMPAIRKIIREAAANDYRMSSFILGVVKSAAFQNNSQALLSEPEVEGTGGK